MQWLKNRVLTPLVNSIRNGISEHVLSFSIALGFVSGEPASMLCPCQPRVTVAHCACRDFPHSRPHYGGRCCTLLSVQKAIRLENCHGALQSVLCPAKMLMAFPAQLANLVVVPLEFLLMPAFLALGGIFTDGDPVSAPAIIAVRALLRSGVLLALMRSFAGAASKFDYWSIVIRWRARARSDCVGTAIAAAGVGSQPCVCAFSAVPDQALDIARQGRATQKNCMVI